MVGRFETGSRRRPRGEACGDGQEWGARLLRTRHVERGADVEERAREDVAPLVLLADRAEPAGRDAGRELAGERRPWLRKEQGRERQGAPERNVKAPYHVRRLARAAASGHGRFGVGRAVTGLGSGCRRVTSAGGLPSERVVQNTGLLARSLPDVLNDPVRAPAFPGGCARPGRVEDLLHALAPPHGPRGRPRRPLPRCRFTAAISRSDS
jgi:hypothetical protein